MVLLLARFASSTKVCCEPVQTCLQVRLSDVALSAGYIFQLLVIETSVSFSCRAGTCGMRGGRRETDTAGRKNTRGDYPALITKRRFSLHRFDRSTSAFFCAIYRKTRWSFLFCGRRRIVKLAHVIFVEFPHSIPCVTRLRVHAQTVLNVSPLEMNSLRPDATSVRDDAMNSITFCFARVVRLWPLREVTTLAVHGKLSGFFVPVFGKHCFQRKNLCWKKNARAKIARVKNYTRLEKIFLSDRNDPYHRLHPHLVAAIRWINARVRDCRTPTPSGRRSRFSKAPVKSRTTRNGCERRSKSSGDSCAVWNCPGRKVRESRRSLKNACSVSVLWIARCEAARNFK